MIELPTSLVEAQTPCGGFDRKLADITVRRFLGHVLGFLKKNQECTCTRDCILTKHTVCFKVAQLSVDLTACVGSPGSVHIASQVTWCVKQALDSCPPLVRSLATLIVDAAKRRGIAWVRSDAS